MMKQAVVFSGVAILFALFGLGFSAASPHATVTQEEMDAMRLGAVNDKECVGSADRCTVEAMTRECGTDEEGAVCGGGACSSSNEECAFKVGSDCCVTYPKCCMSFIYTCQDGDCKMTEHWTATGSRRDC